MTWFDHRLRTDLANVIEHFSFVSTLLRKGREKKTQPIAVDYYII